MKQCLVITKKEELSLLLSNSNFKSITVNFPNLNKDYNSYWTSKIEKVYNACGCKTGYRFFVFSLIISVFYISIYSNTFIDNRGILIFKALLFIVSMAAIGKALGLLIAKVKLKKYIHEIKTL